MFSAWRQGREQGAGRRRQAQRPRTAGFRPQLEALETRTLPNAAPQVALPASVLVQDRAVVLTAMFADPDSTAWTATVDYGDGSGPQPLALNADRTFTLNHAYTRPGSHRITVEVTDDAGATGRANVLIHSEGGLNALPFPVFGVETELPPGGQPVVFATPALFQPPMAAPIIVPPLTQLDPFAAGVASLPGAKAITDEHWANFGQAAHDANEPLQVKPAAAEVPAPPVVEPPMQGPDRQTPEQPRNGETEPTTPPQPENEPTDGVQREDRHQVLAAGIFLPWKSANVVILVLLIGCTSRGRRLKLRRARVNWQRIHRRLQRTMPGCSSHRRSRAPPRSRSQSHVAFFHRQFRSSSHINACTLSTFASTNCNANIGQGISYLPHRNSPMTGSPWQTRLGRPVWSGTKASVLIPRQ